MCLQVVPLKPRTAPMKCPCGGLVAPGGHDRLVSGQGQDYGQSYGRGFDQAPESPSMAEKADKGGTMQALTDTCWLAWTHGRASRRGVVMGVTLLSAVSACDTSSDIELLFQRQANDPTQHVFPSDEYRGQSVLDGFSEVQVATLPFLRQLRANFQTAWAPTTGIRIPFTEVSDPDRWLDVESVPDAVRIYRVDVSPAKLVPLGELRHAMLNLFDSIALAASFGPEAPAE